MTDAATCRLSDWRPYPFALLETRLDFRLEAEATIVRSALRFESRMPGADLVLDGAGLSTRRLAIDGGELDRALLPKVDGPLVIPSALLPAGAFTFEAEVAINPSANTALEGLYLSNGMFCTQCEAQGFRHITWYPDRPDVMAPFRVRIEAAAPVILSNGNPVASGPGWAEWHDPWPKPAYLFALVAGTLEAASDRFVTASGREVALNVWV